MTAEKSGIKAISSLFTTVMCIMTMLVCTGCLPPKLTKGEDLEIFRSIVPLKTNASIINDALRAKVPSAEYKLVSGDKISISMLELMEDMGGPEHTRTNAVERRVRTDGTISLPMLEEDLSIAGKTLLETEQIIENAYWPEFVVNRPSIVVDVDEYAGIFVSIAGQGIEEPGLYMLRSDMQSLESLLMQAGGINDKAGAEKIVITPEADDARPIVITVSPDGMLSDDVRLAGGERVVVYPMSSSAITIIGQCNKPGRYGISRTTPMTLIEALGQAGGVNEIMDPRYVSVYRKDANNEIVQATFRLNRNKGLGYMNLLHDDQLGDSSFALLQPGDIVVLERTARSRTRQFISQVVHLSVGASANTSVTYHDDLADDGSGRNQTNVSNDYTGSNFTTITQPTE